MNDTTTMHIDSPARPGVALAALNCPPHTPEQTKESLNELTALAETLGFTVVDTFMQSRSAPDPRTFIGRGKLEQMGFALAEKQLELVLFDHDLSPKQSQLIESTLDCMVWDRTQVILEIFARHARTSEAKTQVELARLEYMLPRLVGLWAHLDRERGGIGASRGMGEKQINIDRHIIRKRINKLQKDLKKIGRERTTRKKNRRDCFQIGLVGYTNAGKSTLMNLLTGNQLPTADQLFATLDSTTRTISGIAKPEMVISDTVGFIRNLPHALVASFRSTLDVVQEADLLLHVVDASHPAADEHIATTLEVLEKIGSDTIPQILLLNKTDLVSGGTERLILEKRFPGAILTSARDPRTRELITNRLKKAFQSHFFSRTIKLPYSKCSSLSALYAHSIVGNIAYRDDAIYVDCTISHANKNKFAELL